MAHKPFIWGNPMTTSPGPHEREVSIPMCSVSIYMHTDSPPHIHTGGEALESTKDHRGRTRGMCSQQDSSLTWTTVNETDMEPYLAMI